MLEQIVKTAYKEFTLRFYHELFARFQDQETGLTAAEIFAAEAIRALGSPTVNEFAAFMHVSIPNAAYKINSLVRKGYVEKTRSAQDKREYILHVTRKYETYCGAGDRVQSAVARIRERFTPEECAKFGEMLSVISEELLPLSDDDTTGPGRKRAHPHKTKQRGTAPTGKGRGGRPRCFLFIPPRRGSGGGG